MDASLDKAKSKLKHWEQEVKVGGERIVRMKKERDEAKQEAKVARLAASEATKAKARAKEDLARVQEALVATEEGSHKAKAKIAHLEVERTSLLLELGATKDEVPSLYSEAGRDKEAIEAEYHKALEVIFSYGVRVLCVQTQHLWRPSRGSRRYT